MADGDIGYLQKMERFRLRKRFKKFIVQGFFPQETVAGLYELIREVWEEEFREENGITTDFALREAFEASQCFPNTDKADKETVEFLKSKIDKRKQAFKKSWTSI